VHCFGAVTIQAPNAEAGVASLPTSELIREALEETKELARLEVKLAREEVRDDLLQLKGFAIFAGVAVVLGIVTVTLLFVAIIFALGATTTPAAFTPAAFIVFGVLAVISAVLGGIAYQRLPKVPLQRTQARLKADLEQFKEHVA
jgi:uncharacterized membrane protein YqjE